MKKAKFVMLEGAPISWDEFVGEVRKMLADQKGQMRAIESRTGLTYRWIVDFKRGVYRDVTTELVIRLAQGLGLSVKMVVSRARVAKAPVARASAPLRKPASKK